MLDQVSGDPDTELWLDVPGYGSPDAYTDMADFTADQTDRECADLAASLEERGAFCRFQNALNRHGVHRVHWRVFSTERRLDRARAWLAEQGFDASLTLRIRMDAALVLHWSAEAAG